MKKSLLAVIVLAGLLSPAWVRAQEDAKQDMKDAAKSTEQAAKNTGHKVKSLVSKICGLIPVPEVARAYDIRPFPSHRRYGIHRIVWSPLEFYC